METLRQIFPPEIFPHQGMFSPLRAQEFKPFLRQQNVSAKVQKQFCC